MTSNFRWHHALLIFAIANILSSAYGILSGDFDRNVNYAQPALAPPSWVFGPVWFTLNVLSLIGLYQVMNGNRHEGFRRSVFRWEIIGWVLYALFSNMYFGLRSPILAAVVTVAFFLVTVIVCQKTFLNQPRAFWFFLPRLLWTGFASYLSVWIAINNSDAIFN